jgi:predicted nucleic acid-binding protein
MKYVVDTNIINWLIDGKIDRAALPSDGKFVATHIQVDEINRTSDEDRRARLSLTLISTIRELLPTESAVMDISRFDWCKMGDGVIYTSIKNELDAENGERRSNIRDALIAEVAIVNGFTLLTADADLAEIAKNHKGVVRHFAV